MKTAIQLSLIAALALLISCKKTDNVSKTPAEPVKHKYLTKETRVTSYSDGISFSAVTDYTYDDKKRLISAKTDNGETTYAYYDDGTLYLVTNTSGSIKQTYETTYVAGRLNSVSYKTYINEKLQGTDTYTLIYSDFGNRLTELRVDGYHGLFITEYSYNDKNTIARTSLNLGLVVTDYTYDDKKNRYIDMPSTVKNIVTGGVEYLAPNNVLSQKTVNTSPKNVTTTVNNFTYTYDSDGYPMSRVQTAGSQTITYTYTYAEP